MIRAASAYAFHGGPQCNSGNSICSCPAGGIYTELDLERETEASLLECAEACRDDPMCKYALFRGQNGNCALMSGCAGRSSTWIGAWGGVTFEKWMPPPSPPFQLAQ